jgi:heptose I phosphotransferase
MSSNRARLGSELWLDPVFSAAWQGQDAFAAARALDGKVFRALEQRQTLAFTLQGQRYFIKRHQGARLGEIFKNLLSLRLPVVSARNEFRALRAMQACALRVPQPAAYGRRGLLPAQLESFLVTHDVGPHESLEDHCRDWAVQAPDFRHKQQLLQQVADIARRMHGAGICHRDFYLCHFLRRDSDGELVLIDLHRALVQKRLRQRWIIKDLGGLWFSAMAAGLTQRDLWRFMVCYRQQPLRQILAQEAGFWRAVRQRADKLWRRHAPLPLQGAD